jgi:hypothetical protein
MIHAVTHEMAKCCLHQADRRTTIQRMARMGMA